MKILLVQPMTYLFLHGGAHKANRLLVEGLGEFGHQCRAVTLTTGAGDPMTYPELLAELAERQVSVTRYADGITFTYKGVEVHTANDYLSLCAELIRNIREFQPDLTIVTEDGRCLLLEAALEASPARVVYLAHSSSTLPFGPDSRSTDANTAGLFHKTVGIMTVSNYMKRYFRQWAGLESSVFFFPAYGAGPFRRTASYDNGFVTIINPSLIKGISIFLEMARRMSDIEFAAVPTWATTYENLIEMSQLRNVHILKPSNDIDEIFSRTRVLLVPSLWSEAFAAIIVEAMLRGIPVVASESGGIPEAMLGVGSTIPVRRIERYDHGKAVVPEQDVDAWVNALRDLVGDRQRYEQRSLESFERALAFATNLSLAPFASYLENLTPANHEGAQVESKPDGQSRHDMSSAIGNLSPEKRALLALRLKKRLG